MRSAREVQNALGSSKGNITDGSDSSARHRRMERTRVAGSGKDRTPLLFRRSFS